MELQQNTKTDLNGLIPPYGGELKNLIIKDNSLKNDLISKATYAVSYTHLTLPTKRSV